MIDTASGRTRATFEHSPNQGFEFTAGGKWLVMALNPVADVGIPEGTNLTGVNTTAGRAVRHEDVPTDRRADQPLLGSLPFEWDISPDGTRFVDRYV